ncbi:polyribonucleotide nucleotidyltransferase [Fusibacter sp. JL216-2]|uniref:polyribonucleotide nucleotidyltransferase n=1 Tax=Fusibacter sp. JL216-2 TaxID=3071453 RepID=UPI003D335832
MERVIKTFQTEIAGRSLEVEVGKIANLANGSCVVKYGDTHVLVTATMSGAREGIDFFPLSVEFEEKLYSVGKIPGGFLKREGRPSEKAVLAARLIDRPIRPLFPDGFKNEVQVIATIMSVEQDNAPEMAAMLGSSIALSISDIPFHGPTASVTVGLVDGEYVINPTVEQREASSLNLIVSGTRDAVVMVEAGADVLSESEMLEAIMFGHDEIKKIIAFIDSIVEAIGKEKQEFVPPEENEDLKAKVVEWLTPKMDIAVREPGKKERNVALSALKDELVAAFEEEHEEEMGFVKSLFKTVEKDVVRKMITEEGVRPDGRGITDIRPVSAEIGLLPRTHGSGLFTRGLTQALSVATLGALGEAQRIDGLDDTESKRWMHHYNFPPFSVGETGFARVNRRAIGHGALGERALVPVLPSEEDFPYTIRVVSEVVTCNGSSSQASICGTSLALMDAGVPIKAPVAGIAMGLISEGQNISILSDIQGMEDALGDMDFKVAGTTEGITALQMDIKIEGLPREIMEKALEQARQGRLFILGKMTEVIEAPKEEMSPYAPRVISMRINPDKIRDVIGPGGKVVTRLTSEHNCKIDINDEGLVLITAEDGVGGEGCRQEIEMITKDIEVGTIYTGKITRIMDFGAFVEVLPGKEGLVHISQLTVERLEKITDKFSVGDELQVKCVEIDGQGRVNLSRQVLLEGGRPYEPKKPSGNRGGGRDRNNRRPRRD